MPGGIGAGTAVLNYVLESTQRLPGWGKTQENRRDALRERETTRPQSQGQHQPLSAAHFPRHSPQASAMLCFARRFFTFSINLPDLKLTGVYFSFIINEIIHRKISNEFWAQQAGPSLLLFHCVPCRLKRRMYWTTTKCSSGSDILLFWSLFGYFVFGSMHPKASSWTNFVYCVQAFLVGFQIRHSWVATLTTTEPILWPSVSWPHVCSFYRNIKGGDRQQTSML